jgi:arylformamidase
MIDITRPLDTRTAAWPGDTGLGIDWTLHMSRGDNVTLSCVTLSPHVGTHADAPLHYEPHGSPTGEFDLSAFIGPVRVVDARGQYSVTPQLLSDCGAIGVPRLLVRSLDVVRPEEFVSAFPPLAADAAQMLVSAGLKLYGTDAPSVDPVDSAAMSAHRALGSTAIPILENLDLSRAEPGDYDLLALPMKLTETEATPVRAVLLPAGALHR